jgi:hypothetical protein
MHPHPEKIVFPTSLLKDSTVMKFIALVVTLAITIGATEIHASRL